MYSSTGGMPPQSAEIAPAKMINAILFAKSVQAIWSFSSGSLTYWTIWTILLLEPSSFFSKAILPGLITTLFQWILSSSTYPSILESRNLPALPTSTCSPGHPVYSSRSLLFNTDFPSQFKFMYLACLVYTATWVFISATQMSANYNFWYCLLILSLCHPHCFLSWKHQSFQ